MNSETTMGSLLFGLLDMGIERHRALQQWIRAMAGLAKPKARLVLP